ALSSMTGMEQAANDVLGGTADSLVVQRLQDLVTGRQPQGGSVELTIDPDAQRAAWDALGDARGAVVALDTRTGAILAMVSKPSFDPNTLAVHSGTAAGEAYDALLADPADPLVNRAIAGDLYAPGSSFKVVVAAAAIEELGLEADDPVPSPAQLQLPLSNRVVGNPGGIQCTGNDTAPFRYTMEQSCNTTFAQLGMDLGEDVLREQAEAFGFGQELPVPLPGRDGRRPDRDVVHRPVRRPGHPAADGDGLPGDRQRRAPDAALPRGHRAQRRPRGGGDHRADRAAPVHLPAHCRGAHRPHDERGGERHRPPRPAAGYRGGRQDRHRAVRHRRPAARLVHLLRPGGRPAGGCRRRRRARRRRGRRRLRRHDGGPDRARGPRRAAPGVGMAVAAGHVLRERYELISRIAVGGMGEVWRAHDRQLDRTVAAKVLRPDLVGDTASLARLRAEARNASRVIHPNVAVVLDHGERDGTGFLVLEYVPGEPLSRLLGREGTVPAHRLLPLLAQCARGLHAVHEAGVVHRDVKPSNVLI